MEDEKEVVARRIEIDKRESSSWMMYAIGRQLDFVQAGYLMLTA
jgi:hypothetical protein